MKTAWTSLGLLGPDVSDVRDVSRKNDANEGSMPSLDELEAKGSQFRWWLTATYTGVDGNEETVESERWEFLCRGSD